VLTPLPPSGNMRPIVDKLRFTYDQPDEPLPTSGDGPIAHRWLPPMRCSSFKDEPTIIGECAIPWYANLQEIWVESRKAYEVLCGVTRPARSNPLVRIVPPVPGHLEPHTKHGILVVANTPTDCAWMIARELGADISIKDARVDALLSAEVLVCPFEDLESVAIYALAIAAGCKIVCSDANAAEEYIQTNTQPGAFRIVHNLNPVSYVEATKSVLCQPNEFLQHPYIDKVPYDTPYG
jgi:hypothetical protein